MKIAFHPNTPPLLRNPADLRGTPMSAGLDLRVAEFAHPEVDVVHLVSGAVIDVTFHISVDLRTTFEESGDTDEFPADEPMLVSALLLPRSGLGTKGLTLVNGTGVIDMGYTSLLRGSLVYNARPGVVAPLVLNRWDRVAQLVILPVLRPQLTVVDVMAVGRGGFGSTGVR